MGNYSKFIGAIIGAIAARWLLKWTGLDLAALGVAGEFNELIAVGIEAGVAAAGGLIAGVVVYVFPANKPKEEAIEFTGENL